MNWPVGKTNGGGRRGGVDRRKAQLAFQGIDRREGERRSGQDRRRTERRSGLIDRRSNTNDGRRRDDNGAPE